LGLSWYTTWSPGAVSRKHTITEVPAFIGPWRRRVPGVILGSVVAGITTSTGGVARLTILLTSTTSTGGAPRGAMMLL